MAESRQMLFLKLATKNNLLDPEQAEEILSAIEDRKELGVTKTPAELAVEKGFLSQEQVDAIDKALRSTLPPEKIGGFEIRERLGRGAVGTVYKARQVSLDKVVAVKVLHQSLTKHAKFVQQFIKEARAVAKLNHPHVVHALDAGFEDGYNYFAMEFVDGHTLRDELKKCGRLPESQALAIGLAAAQGLDNAHRNGILHRDMKPDNILLGNDGQIKVGDFGLAHPIDNAELMAEEHRRMGSPYYLSPEQASGKSLDERSDLYSVGATLYHCLLGKPVFTGSTVSEIFTKQIHQPPVPLREAGAEVSEETEAMVAKLLEKDPAARFQSATELVEAIHGIRRSSTGPDAAATAIPRGRARSSSGARGSARAAAGPRTAKAAGRTRRSVGTSRDRSEPLVSAGEQSRFKGKRQNTWAMVGGCVGGLLALVFVLLAVKNNNARKEDEAATGGPEAVLQQELTEIDLAKREERKKQWIEEYVTVPSKNINTALSKFERKAGGDTGLLLAGLWKALEDNPTAPNTFDLVEKIEQVRKDALMRNMNQAESGIFARARELGAEQRYWEAIMLLDRDLPKEFRKDKLVSDKADNMILEWESEIDSRFNEEMARARKLHKDKQYDRALEILDGIAHYADPDSIKEAEKIRADIDDEREVYMAQERKRLTADEKKRYRQFAAEYTALCQERDFKGCISKALELESEVTSDEVRRMVEQDLKAFQMLDNFMKDFLKACESGIGTNKLYRIVLKDKTKYHTGIAKTGDDKIWLLIKSGGGTAQLPIEILKINDESIFKTLSDYHGAEKAEYLVPMGILYTYRRQTDVAREFLRQAQLAGADIHEWITKIDELTAS